MSHSLRLAAAVLAATLVSGCALGVPIWSVKTEVTVDCTASSCPDLQPAEWSASQYASTASTRFTSECGGVAPSEDGWLDLEVSAHPRVGDAFTSPRGGGAIYDQKPGDFSAPPGHLVAPFEPSAEIPALFSVDSSGRIWPVTNPLVELTVLEGQVIARYPSGATGRFIVEQHTITPGTSFLPAKCSKSLFTSNGWGSW